MFLRSVEGYRSPQYLAIETVDERPVGPAQFDRTFGHGFKHRVKIERRPADDIENLRRGRLLLERLPQLTQEPRVLNGDHGLIGEGGDQPNLPLGERPHCVACECKHPDGLAPSEHRCAQHGPVAADFWGFGHSVFGVRSL